MPPQFPHTHVKSVKFSNYSATISDREVALYCTPEGGTDVSVLRKHGDALRAILGYCFAQNPPATLRPIGSTWSFSRIIEPGDVILDTANFTFMQRIPTEFFTQSYRERAEAGFVPMFVEGGTQIASINRRLGGKARLALRTSGAGDGHRIAGCIATGTHGSAFRLGAVHDTVLGLYLVVGPERAVFLQSSSSQFCLSEVAPWLQEQSGIPTEHHADDGLFHAALVSLGSFGVALGVVLEVEPLYRLKFRSAPHRHDEPAVWQAISTLDTRPLHPDIAATPHHFDVLMHPYPEKPSSTSVVTTLMWKVAAGTTPLASPPPALPRASSDLMGVIAELATGLAGPVTAPVALPLLRELISQQLHLRAIEGEAFPGELFGPTSLPAGTGASTEIVVDQVDAARSLRVVFQVLDQQKTHGKFLLGAIGVRFVPQTQALLGMNRFPMNCYIELPSIRTDAVLGLYRKIWDALDQDGIPFTCHWGQLHGITSQRLERYFGPRVTAWKAARATLLSPTAHSVFAAPILSEVGLG